MTPKYSAHRRPKKGKGGHVAGLIAVVALILVFAGLMASRGCLTGGHVASLLSHPVH